LESLVKQLAHELAHEPRADRRRHHLLARQALWRPELVTRLYDEMVNVARLDLRQAERLARAAVWISERLDDESSRAVGLRAIGHVFSLKRKYPLAWERYEAALAIYERLGSDLEVGRTLSGALSTLMYLGRYDEALQAAQRARAIFSKQADRLRLARLDTNTGNILNRQARFEDALELYERAYADFLEIGDPQDVAITLRNLATCHINLNDFPRALETYRNARTYCERYQMPLLAAEADYNIAYLYYLRGEYARAIELYRDTRDHCQAAGDAYHAGLCDLDQSEMYLELNLGDEGGRLALRALHTFRRLGMGYEAAKALTNLAVSASRDENASDALRQFRKARALFARERNRSWMAIIDLYQALVFYQEAKLPDARGLCERAFQFLETSPLRGKAVLCQLLLARIQLGAGEPEAAKRICLAVLPALKHTESPILHYQTRFVLGLVEEALGAMDAAQEAYERAYELIESLRSRFHAEEMRIGFLKDKMAVYESLVRIRLDRGFTAADHQIAFLYIERAKSRALADLIARRAQKNSPSPHLCNDLSNRVHDLREQLIWFRRTIQALEERAVPPTDPQLEKLRRDAGRCEQQLLEEFTRLRVEDPEFATLHDAISVDIDKIRSALAPDAILLQYYTVRDVLHVCILSRHSLRIVALGSAAELQSLLQLLRFQFSKFRFGMDNLRAVYSRLVETTKSHLRDCYRLLLGPIEGELQARHLVIAPHGCLHSLPFHALFDGEQYLGDRFTVSYTPSASVYYLCCSKSRRTSAGALVLAIPDFSAPHILEEVEAVASVLPEAEVYVGATATREVFRARAPQSRFIHIATHGRFRPDSPMFSSIDLGDSPLTLLDLYDSDLPAELVTLSGCGTGLNVVVGGDELLGLVRGLLYAGAQSALGTLWDVNDHSTAEFMRRFYQRLTSGANKAVAVQYAMTEVREDYPHPFHWAPFVLVGQYR
jgi:CHAT domain-containing protein